MSDLPFGITKAHIAEEQDRRRARAIWRADIDYDCWRARVRALARAGDVPRSVLDVAASAAVWAAEHAGATYSWCYRERGNLSWGRPERCWLHWPDPENKGLKP